MKHIVLCLALSGCASMISSKPAPADWPKLAVSVHRVSLYEVFKRCGKYLTPSGRLISMGLVQGCAEVRFATMRCDIWMQDNDPAVLEHEMDHCFGKDHPGDSTLRDAWLAYRAEK